MKQDQKGDRHDKGTEIRQRLGGHHAEGLKTQGQEQDGGQEEDALTAGGEKGSLPFEAQALVELVDVGGQSHEGHDRRRGYR